MKTKEEILKMTKEEIEIYKWSPDLRSESNYCNDCYNCYYCNGCNDCDDCYNCYDCDDCDDCYNCYNCNDCYCCRRVKGLRFAICNVELTEEEYRTKIKELKIKSK